MLDQTEAFDLVSQGKADLEDAEQYPLDWLVFFEMVMARFGLKGEPIDKLRDAIARRKREAE
jgi:hypothetical protein